MVLDSTLWVRTLAVDVDPTSMMNVRINRLQLICIQFGRDRNLLYSGRMTEVIQIIRMKLKKV